MREVRMTFGEHLEELRTRIFLALLWLSIAVAISFVYGMGLLKWVMGPHESAIRNALREKSTAVIETRGQELLALTRSTTETGGGGGNASPWGWDELFAADLRRSALEQGLRPIFEEFARKLGAAVPPGDVEDLSRKLAEAIAAAMGENSLPMNARSLPARFRELERDLKRSADRIGTLPVKKLLGTGRSLETALIPLRQFNQFLDARRKALLDAPIQAAAAPGSASQLVLKLESLYESLDKEAKSLAYENEKPPMAISYLEPFMTYFKVALVFGLFFSCPFILYEMWKFIGAGLYPHEQRYVLVFMPFSIALFVLGVLFGYFSVIPVALEFLAGWGADIVELNFTLANYVGLFFTLTILLGLVFQTPLVMIFLAKVGILDAEGFRRGRKLAILGSVILAGIVTPPDPMSWLLVAGPVVALYELGIVIISLGGKKKAKVSSGGLQPENTRST